MSCKIGLVVKYLKNETPTHNCRRCYAAIQRLIKKRMQPYLQIAAFINSIKRTPRNTYMRVIFRKKLVLAHVGSENAILLSAQCPSRPKNAATSLNPSAEFT